MKAKEIMEFISKWTPESLAEDWDNVGFQIGNENTEVEGVVVALDLDERVYKYAKENNCNMIITHHPFIFKGLKSITNRSYDGRLIMELIKSDMVFYAAHTNLDQARDGVNEKLGDLFNLRNSEVLDERAEDKKLGYGKIGEIDEMKVKDFIGLVKDKLNVDKITVFGDINKTIKKLALVGGSGSSFIELAKEKGADILLTGDIKYHDGQLAEKLGLTLVDGGHFYTERVILREIEEKIKGLNKDLIVKTYKYPSPIYDIY